MAGRLQHRGLHHLIDAVEGGVCQHHAGGGEHDLCESGGNDGRKHGVKGKICDKAHKIPASQGTRSQKQGRRHQKHKGALSKSQVDRLGHPAHVPLVMLRLGAILLNRLLKRLKGIHRLLEDLHHGNTPDILGARLGHPVLGRLVLRHDLSVLPSHHGKHGDHGDHRRQKAGPAHPPVKHKHERHHGQKQHRRSHNVRQIMGQQRLRISRRRVQTAADQAGGVGVKEPQRRLHHVGHSLFANVGGGAEGGQMGAHQAKKIQDNAGHRETKGHPAISCDPLSPRPLRGHGDQIPGRQPDTDVGRHAQHHGHRRQHQPQKGQVLPVSRVIQQNGYAAFSLLFHPLIPPYKYYIVSFS